MAKQKVFNGYYNIVRTYFNKPGYRRVILSWVTLEQAQTHCQNPETSSSTCTGSTGKACTRRNGVWFDGYEKVYR